MTIADSFVELPELPPANAAFLDALAGGVRKLPRQSPRVESGPIQFDEDSPGVFIRGDNATMYAIALENYLANTDGDFLDKGVLTCMIHDLRACRIRKEEDRT